MSEYESITDPAELRKLIKTKELRENELSPKQRVALYGKGNPGTVMYRAVEQDGKKQIVQRTFGPGDKIPQGWVDSPLKCGLKKPKPKKDREGETVFATLEGGEDEAKAEAARRQALIDEARALQGNNGGKKQGKKQGDK